MKIYTTDKAVVDKANSAGPILKSDTSLCKVKVKRSKSKAEDYESRDPQNNRIDEKEDVQRYVVSSKKRKVVLQFESPVQRKRNNRTKGTDVRKGPEGAVQGIKNLGSMKRTQFNQKIVNKEMKRNGFQDLEGTYIVLDGKSERPDSALGYESYDEHMDVYDENNEVEVEKDDNVYYNFLKAIQCRTSVYNIKCDSLKCDGQDKYVNQPTNEATYAKVPITHEELLSSSREKGDEKISLTMENQVKSVDYIDEDYYEIDRYEESVRDSGQDELINVEATKNQVEPVVARTFFGTLGALGKDTWETFGTLGILVYDSGCGNTGNTDFGEKCTELYKCGNDIMSDDELSLMSIEPPTALYAAIGTKNWNVALRRLIEAPDEASIWVHASEASEDDTLIQFLPLHLACLTGAPLLLITLLVQTYPEALRQDAIGKLPIHIACEAQVDHRIVFLLLSRYPESLEMEDDDGNKPIDIASLADENKERAKIIQVLTKKMENTVVTNPTALYDAIDSQNWNYAMRRLVETPQESTIWVSFSYRKSTEMRFLPLHIACAMGAPLLLVEDLIQTYPDAIRKKTTDGNLPLHLACGALVDPRIVQLLVDQFQDGLSEKNAEGNTALDIACNADPCPEREKILEVLTSKVDSEDEKNVFVPTKLYTLIEEKKWDFAVRRLLEAPDEALTWIVANEKKPGVKYLPLHMACSVRAPLILVAMLIQSYPESVRKTICTGKLPLHIACEKQADHRIVGLLLHSWPDSYFVKDSKGQTCVQVALLSKSCEQRAKIIEVLMAFEAKGTELLTINGLGATIEDEKIEKAPIDRINGGADHIQGDEEVDWNANVKKSKPKKKTYYIERKNLFQWNKKKTLWDKDEDMFQS